MQTPPLTLAQALNQLTEELRKEKGWSQEELAEQLDVSQALVSKMLSAERRQHALDFYERLAKCFDVPLWQLLRRADARRGVRRRPRTVDYQLPELPEDVDLDTVIQHAQALQKDAVEMFKEALKIREALKHHRTQAPEQVPAPPRSHKHKHKPPK